MVSKPVRHIVIDPRNWLSSVSSAWSGGDSAPTFFMVSRSRLSNKRMFCDTTSHRGLHELIMSANMSSNDGRSDTSTSGMLLKAMP